MSGHSKWNNITRKKEKTDGQKAKIFTKMGREISVAVKEGGSADPSVNSKLKDAIAKAKADLIEAGAIYAAMSGSGSTVYGIFSDRGRAEMMLNQTPYLYML